MNPAQRLLEDFTRAAVLAGTVHRGLARAPLVKTERDRQAIAAAVAKRARKNAKRLSHSANSQDGLA